MTDYQQHVAEFTAAPDSIFHKPSERRPAWHTFGSRTHEMGDVSGSWGGA